jgi:hypothetical protein
MKLADNENQALQLEKNPKASYREERRPPVKLERLR